MEFNLVQGLSGGIVVIETTDHRGRKDKSMWAKQRVRKHKKCAISEKDLYGKDAYAPIGNQSYRAERIDATIIDKVLNGLKASK